MNNRDVFATYIKLRDEDTKDSLGGRAFDRVLEVVDEDDSIDMTAAEFEDALVDALAERKGVSAEAVRETLSELRWNRRSALNYAEDWKMANIAERRAIAAERETFPA